MTKKIYLLLAGPIIIILAAFSIYFYSNRNQEKIVVKSNILRIGHTKASTDLMLFVAQEQGFFANENLNVELKALNSGNEIVNGIIKGDLDAGCCTGITQVFDANQITPNKIKLFSLNDDSKMKPWNKLLVKKDSDIKALTDLSGKNIGVFPGSNATAVLKAYLLSKNVDVSKIELIQLAPPTQLQALEAGSIQALWTYEPTTTIALNQDKYRSIDESIYSKVNSKANLGTGYISVDLIQKDPEQANKFVKAMDKANIFIRQNPTEAAKYLPKYTNISQELATKVVLTDFYTNAESDPESLQATADFLAQIGVIKQKIEVKDLIYKI